MKLKILLISAFILKIHGQDLTYHAAVNGDNGKFCSGALISTETHTFIVTAYACLYNAKEVYYVLGAEDLFDRTLFAAPSSLLLSQVTTQTSCSGSLNICLINIGFDSNTYSTIKPLQLLQEQDFFDMQISVVTISGWEKDINRKNTGKLKSSTVTITENGIASGDSFIETFKNCGSPLVNASNILLGLADCPENSSAFIKVFQSYFMDNLPKL